MRHTRTHKHLFSLVELLVAVAVLSLMMTFLFQFILSAQRVWSGTTNASNVYAQAQVALDVIGNDFQNLLYSSEPAQQCPFYYHTNGDDIYLAYVTRMPSSETSNTSDAIKIKNAGTYLVCLFYDASEGKLYRIPVDTAEFAGVTSLPFYFQGVDYTKATASADEYNSFAYYFNSFLGHEDHFDILAENLLNCTVNLQFDPGKFNVGTPATAGNPYPMTEEQEGYAKSELPIVVRFSLDIYDPNSIRNPSPTLEQRQQASRSFSKIIFLR